MVQTLGIPHDGDFGPITSVEGKAPTKINVYTDGSVLYPSHRWAQIGAYAAYHKPDRSTLQTPTANDTWASYECEFEPTSIKLYGVLNGAFASSNKAEATGTLPALFRTTPLHVGVDNSLAVPTLSKIINGTRTSNSKPWELIPHGDIWKKLGEAIQQRGTETTRITKVKGHATPQHIIDEITTEDHKEGNDIADGRATKAYKCSGHIREFANLITPRTTIHGIRPGYTTHHHPSGWCNARTTTGHGTDKPSTNRHVREGGQKTTHGLQAPRLPGTR